MVSPVESASGVRVRFASASEIPADVRDLAWRYAGAYAAKIRTATGETSPLLVLAYDGRPNGPAIAAIFARRWRAMGARVAWLGRATTPFWESAVRTLEAHGGAMVTASHNPFDAEGGFWNGWKFSTPAFASVHFPVAQGALMPPVPMKALIAEVAGSKVSAPQGTDASLGEIPSMLDPSEDGSVPASAATEAPAAFPVPGNPLSEKVFFGYLAELRADLGLAENSAFGAFRKAVSALEENRRTLVFDCAGGGACGLNAALAGRFGFRVVETNARPGIFERQIEPVGPAVEAARRETVALGALLGCCFDADADRGNVVADADIHPQYAAALNVAARLSAASHAGEKMLAVVAHCAASPLIAETARRLGASVSYVETGEVNVVGRMRALAKEGYVAVGVESYNGGTIFPGSRCRDGLLSALTAAALLANRAELEFLAVKLQTPARPATLPELVALLPRFEHLQGNVKFSAPAPAVTDSEILLAKPFSKEGLAELKNRLDVLAFAPGAWPGFSSVAVRNLLGAECFDGVFDGAAARVRTGNYSGGYRIEMKDAEGRPAAAWFRPSQTGSEFRFGAYARTLEGARAVQKAFAALLEKAA